MQSSEPNFILAWWVIRLLPDYHISEMFKWLKPSMSCTSPISHSSDFRYSYLFNKRYTSINIYFVLAIDFCRWLNASKTSSHFIGGWNFSVKKFLMIGDKRTGVQWMMMVSETYTNWYSLLSQPKYIRIAWLMCVNRSFRTNKGLIGNCTTWLLWVGQLKKAIHCINAYVWTFSNPDFFSDFMGDYRQNDWI